MIINLQLKKDQQDVTFDGHAHDITINHGHDHEITINYDHDHGYLRLTQCAYTTSATVSLPREMKEEQRAITLS